MTRSGMTGLSGNALLDSFPEDVLQRLGVTTEHYDTHHVVMEADESPRSAHFPHFGAVVSLTRTTEEGTTVEVGIIGSEGVVAVQNLLLPQPSGSDGVVQIAGDISIVSLESLRAVMNESAPVREALLAFAGRFIAQVSQHATCNRVHSIEQRLAKWLLIVRDRIDKDEMELTHDFLSHMLGVRRAGATVAAGALALDGIIAQERGRITIVDREGLEKRACECFRVVRELNRPTRRH